MPSVKHKRQAGLHSIEKYYELIHPELKTTKEEQIIIWD